MRLAAQMRGGFYPAPEPAVALAASLLRPPRQPFTILDPCAGEGAALRQLGASLGCPQERTFAIELDESRAPTVRAALPEASVLAPADCFGCRASGNSFSLIWLNPPFDQSLGGRRVEERFLQVVTDWLVPGGVIAFVCPEDVVDDYSEARRHFTVYYENCTLVPFPAGCRAFEEVIVLAHKRARPMGGANGLVPAWDAIQAPKHFLYHLPPGTGPRYFQKVEPTEPELQRLLERSPLRSHLAAPSAVPLPSPPLALGVGHVALLLASGHLDGVVQPAGQPPHVVRGTSRKREHVSDVAETEEPDGGVTTRTTITERIYLVVRTVDGTGRLHTYTDAGEDAPEA